MEACRIKVSGRVQGVGFRAFVKKCAESHSVVGEVWNTRDASVEIIACSSTLQNFIAELKNGPGHIAEVLIESHQPIDARDFMITETR